MMLVKVGRSADRHCLRRDVGMGSREMILDTSSSETKEKELSRPMGRSVFRWDMRRRDSGRRLQGGIQFENFF